MNRDDYGEITSSFFNMSDTERETYINMSVITLGMLYNTIDITIYNIEDNKTTIVSINDIFDDIEYIDEYSNISYIDESFG